MRIAALNSQEVFDSGCLYEGEVSPDVLQRTMETLHVEGGYNDMDADIQALDDDLYKAMVIAYPASFFYDWADQDEPPPWQRFRDCYGVVVMEHAAGGGAYIPTWNAADHAATIALVQAWADGEDPVH